MARGGGACLDVAVICSDPTEHRRRVEDRVSDIPGLVLPTWAQVQARACDTWERPPLVLDTAGAAVEDGVARVLAALPPGA